MENKVIEQMKEIIEDAKTTYCDVCGVMFPEVDSILFGSSIYCPKCFNQMMRESGS